MTVERRLPDGAPNPKEPNSQQIYMTSAGSKTSFAYSKLLDIFEEAIIYSDTAFVFGCDYRVPLSEGLISAAFINGLRISPSYNEQTFAREFLSLWSSANDESWFNFDRLTRYRRIKNPEKHAREQDNYQFYIMSVDIGRIHDQTVVCIFRVNVKDSICYATLVNIFVLGRTPETKATSTQVIEIKKLIRDFKPREVVMDTNGIGVSFGDEMTKVHYDELGQLLPAYGFFNDANYKATQPKDAICILYSLKASSNLKSQIHGNVYARVNSGKVRLLIDEKEAKSALLATAVGQKMSIEERIKRLMPHELTTRLLEEMANLRLKMTSTQDIVLEQINSHFPDDKYMAFAYGLWRIKELEEENFKKMRKRVSTGPRKLIFYTSGGQG